MARTDARQAAGLEEALWRVEAFADAGADVLFIDALESTEEMERFLAAGGCFLGVLLVDFVFKLRVLRSYRAVLAPVGWLIFLGLD